MARRTNGDLLRSRITLFIYNISSCSFFNFKFKNIGKAPLIVSSASASCGCTVPEYSKDPVLAGQEGFIKVTFNSEGKHGMVSKTVTLLANTIPNTKVLTISADIQTKEDN